MVNYEEKVFHPNLGICDVTGIDKKEKEVPVPYRSRACHEWVYEI